MKRVVLSVGLTSFFIAALAAAATRTPSTQPARQPWSHYEVVVDHDIFMRQAGTGGQGPRKFSVGSSEAGKTWALAGTALMASDRVAFLENTRTGTTIRVHEGDTTDAGQVVHIENDHFDLSADGRVTSVSIGSTLDGLPRESTTQPTTEPDDTNGAAESSLPPAPAGSIEAAMRARREQELSHH